MSHLKKLEQVLDLLINEETEQATDLLHDIVVQKARQIYEELVDDETMGEDFGGDMTTDYADDVAQAEDEIETDELYNSEDQEGVVDADDEAGVEDRLDDLEGQFQELEARFAELSGEEFDDEESDEFGDEMEAGEEGDEGMEDEGEFEGNFEDESEDDLTEATKLSNDVSIDMGKEGKLVGTGNKSKTGSLNTKSPIAGKPEASYKAGNAVKFSNSGKTGNNKPLNPKKDDGFGAKGNVDVSVSNVKADLKKEGKPVGTGKGFNGGSVNAKPVLPKK